LLKPFDNARFERTLERARERVALGRNGRRARQTFVIKAAGQVSFDAASEIDSIEAADYYVSLLSEPERISCVAAWQNLSRSWTKVLSVEFTGRQSLSFRKYGAWTSTRPENTTFSSITAPGFGSAGVTARNSNPGSVSRKCARRVVQMWGL